MSSSGHKGPRPQDANGLSGAGNPILPDNLASLNEEINSLPHLPTTGLTIRRGVTGKF
jgi:hypothetical protein